MYQIQNVFTIFLTFFKAWMYDCSQHAWMQIDTLKSHWGIRQQKKCSSTNKDLYYRSWLTRPKTREKTGPKDFLRPGDFEYNLPIQFLTHIPEHQGSVHTLSFHRKHTPADNCHLVRPGTDGMFQCWRGSNWNRQEQEGKRSLIQSIAKSAKYKSWVSLKIVVSFKVETEKVNSTRNLTCCSPPGKTKGWRWLSRSKTLQ